MVSSAETIATDVSIHLFGSNELQAIETSRHDNMQ